ncbi:MAG TPA: short-chain dehydrogenase [Bacteroidales bacterium]|nr:short-chain dehydrogenase [Bacteroidales bacterium]
MALYLKQRYGKTALVAGASEGLGAAFAEYLAAEDLDLVLIARRLQPLHQLADRLKEKYKVDVTCISCDLGDQNSTKKIKAVLTDRSVNILVYNAAISYIGPFLENPPENHNHAARVNMITPLNMVHYFGNKMLARNKGAIILMTSMAGMQGSGYLSVYAATKAFLRILAESLWFEWRKSGVDIIGCCAGATSTPGYINSDPAETGFFTPRVIPPEKVVKLCFHNLGKRPSFITGRGNIIASVIMHRLMPKKMAVNIMGKTTRKMYRL